MEAIVRAGLSAKVAAVISNRADAPGLKFAAQSGLPVNVVDEREFSSRGTFDAALEAAVQRHSPDLLALAGFMRILGGDFVRHYSVGSSTSIRRCCRRFRVCTRTGAPSRKA